MGQGNSSERRHSLSHNSSSSSDDVQTLNYYAKQDIEELGPYPEVTGQICLKPHWMEHTVIVRYLQVFQNLFDQQPVLLKACESHESKIIRECLKKGGQGRAHSKIQRFYNSRGNNKKNLALAFLLLLKYESSDGIFSLVERMLDHIRRCESAARQAYIFGVKRGGIVFENPVANTSTEWDHLLAEATVAQQVFPEGCRGNEDLKEPLNKVQECVEFFLDGHKEKAFMSSMHEPARYFFHICGNTHHRDHVNVHGLNGYLCLLRSGLGVSLPLLPMENDGDTFKGCTDHWSGLTDTAWADHFSKPENFGKAFEGIKGLQNGNKFIGQRHLGQYHYRDFAGRNAAELGARARIGDPKLSKYMKRYAYFFTQDFLIRRMFENMNAEIEPEYAGFRKACEELFPVYKEEFEIEEDSLVEHLYDEWLTTLDVELTTKFFRWLGVCKPEENIYNPVEPLPSTKHCDNCQVEAPLEFKFCTECGTSFGVVPPESWTELDLQAQQIVQMIYETNGTQGLQDQLGMSQNQAIAFENWLKQFSQRNEM